MTVVSLLQANSLYSRQQAARLEELRLNFTNNKSSSQSVGLHVIGINSRHWPASLMLSELTTQVNFTIYQSSHQNDYWSRLGGYKDDTFVYDRCGNLAYFIPFPYSYISSRYVEAAILSTFHDAPCSQRQSVSSPPDNCSSETGNERSGVVVDDECAAFDEQRCQSVTSRQRQSSSAASRLAFRCCTQYQEQRRQQLRHSRHRHTDRRCVCLPSSGNVKNCVCRPATLTTTQQGRSNCFCSITASQLSDLCS